MVFRFTQIDRISFLLIVLALGCFGAMFANNAQPVETPPHVAANSWGR